MRPLSLRARLTAWYTVTLLLAFLLFAAELIWQQGRIGEGRVDRELDGLLLTLTNVLREEVGESVPAPEQEAIEQVSVPGRATAILDVEGRPISAIWNGLTLSGPVLAAGAVVREWNAIGPAGQWRVHARLEAIADRRRVLIVATPLADLSRDRIELLQAMAIGIPLALLLAAGGGMWLASIGLRPISVMAERASQMSMSGIENLGASERHDELGQLARAFNGLVARLRAALHAQRQFMADASHELRTPVSVIRSAADVTLSREHREEPEYREALSIVDGQARSVSRLVEDMLVLARADAGGYPLHPEHLYFDDLVADVRHTVRLAAAERGIAVTATGASEVPFYGDEDLLKRMVLNLVQNAVHHGNGGSEVTVEVVSTSRDVQVHVTNQGPAIPAADRERIFDRFVQLDPSRRATGSGLGLPIARWIAEAHGGTLTLGPPGEATTFTVCLPLVDAAEGD